MAIQEVHIRSAYKPLTDDPNIRRRINMELDKKANIPTKIADTYPQRGTDIYYKVQSILQTHKGKPIITMPSELTDKTYIDDMLVVMCSFGSSPQRLAAMKKGIELLVQMNPIPKIVLCEGSLDGSWNFEYVKQYPKFSYIAVDLTGEQFINFFAKECLWNHAANTMLANDTSITKLIFLDGDCFFVDRYGFNEINQSFNRYDIISPHRACYYTGSNTEASKYNLLNSTGFVVANNMKQAGYQGFSIGMTVDVYKTYFHSELPNPSLGMGDVFYWWMLAGTKQMKGFRMFPYDKVACQKYLITAPLRIGHANQVIGHVDHGRVDDRIYQVRAQLMKMCAREPFSEIARYGDYIVGWAKNPPADDIRYMYERIRVENRREIKITTYEDTKQYYEWVHGISPNPPRCILPNRISRTGNKMPLIECAIPVPTGKHVSF